MRIINAIKAGLFFSFFLSTFANSDPGINFTQLLQNRLDSDLETVSSSNINSLKPFGVSSIKKLYQQNDYQPLWNSASVAEVLSFINYIDLDGLDKGDYLLPGMADQGECSLLEKLNIPARVQCELTLSESILRIYYHLRMGKIDPVSLDPKWNYAKRVQKDNPYQEMIRIIKEGGLSAWLNEQRTDAPYYLNSRQHWQNTEKLLMRTAGRL